MQIFPYDIYSDRSKAKSYRARIQPDDEPDPSTVTIRTDYSLRDLIDHLNYQDCQLLAIRHKGAWHSMEDRSEALCAKEGRLQMVSTK